MNPANWQNREGKVILYVVRTGAKLYKLRSKK